MVVGVGGVVLGFVKEWVLIDLLFVVVVVYMVGMVFFMMIMGNGFVVFLVMMVGIGLLLIVY